MMGGESCPWCGSPLAQAARPAPARGDPNWAALTCPNCGGPLPALPPERETPAAGAAVDAPALETCPPPPPRRFSAFYLLKLLLRDTWFTGSIVFAGVGGLFVGAMLLIVLREGLGEGMWLFLALSNTFLALGLTGLFWRYWTAHRLVKVLREGRDVEGHITSVAPNLSVAVNGRHPMVVEYQYVAEGRALQGKVSTLNPLGSGIRPGAAVCVLYLPGKPEHSTLYPHL